MIDDIKDLSVIKKQREEKTLWLSRNFWISFIPMLILSIGCFVFALFIGSVTKSRTHSFLSNFSLNYVGETVAFFIAYFIVMFLLFVALFSLNSFNKHYKLGKNYILCSIVITINYAIIIAASTLIGRVSNGTVYSAASAYLLPMSFTSLIIVELIGRKEALISTAILTILNRKTMIKVPQSQRGMELKIFLMTPESCAAKAFISPCLFSIPA